MKFDVWIESHRPQKLDDICGQDDIVKRLKSYVKFRNFPHLMFTGPPGTGKTTSAIALAKELFKDDWTGNFKELNASDERGINVVRTQIKQFASTAPLAGYEFKILFLDESDALTPDAQSALRRTMEKYTTVCKFILSCNYSSKIIEPIQSRCAIFRFRGISPDSMKKRLLYIAKKENVKLTVESLEAIIYVADFDMRKAINSLQSASLMSDSGEITPEHVYKSTGLARPEEIRKLILSSLTKDFTGAVDKLDILTILEGYAGLDILKQVFKEVMIMDMPDREKIEIVDTIGEADFRISEGASETIQLKWLIAKMMRISMTDYDSDVI